MSRYRIVAPARGSRGGYYAQLLLDGVRVGHVSRDPSGNHYRASSYRAVIDGRTAASGRTLRELRAELEEGLEEAERALDKL